MSKKIILATIALGVVVAIMAGVWFATRTKPVEGAKTITVEVLHKDGSVNTYTINTDAQTLAQAMNEKNLLGEDFSGMYYTIDGETTDYSVDESWWKLLINEESAVEGANDIIIVDGATYRWEYTIGWG